MIKRMRLKFIAITMAALLILLAAILITMNVYMNSNWNRQIDEHLNGLVMMDETMPEAAPQPNMPRPKQVDLIQGFSVRLDTDGIIIEVLAGNSTVTDEEAAGYVSLALQSEEQSGEVGSMRFRIRNTNYGKIIAFADTAMQNVMLSNLRDLSYIIGGISVAGLLIIVIVLSRLVTKPVETAFEKQKQFIADSSHELKTPLSIISANADVLEMEIGNNKWIDQLKQQCKRMNSLIHELLVLAKTEAKDSKMIYSDFNLSHAVLNTALAFEVVAFETGKPIKCDIAKDIIYKGDEASIKKMVEALVDNAVKYAVQKSDILVKLFSKGSKKVIEVYNEGQGVSPEQKDRLFEKFYRTDDSRARETGGYGIGLSIVKNIVDIHKGKIEVESKADKYIVFRVTLS